MPVERGVAEHLRKVLIMLEVELDIFSGRENPKWILSQREEQELADRAVADTTQLRPTATGDEQFSLGYRGLIVRDIKTDGGPWLRAAAANVEGLPSEFRIGARESGAGSTAEWLLGTSEPAHKRSGVTDELRALAAQGVDLVESVASAATPANVAEAETRTQDGLGERFPNMTGEGAHTPVGTADEVHVEGATWWACPSNYFTANADVFNRPENVTRNNCYCFASNHLAGVRYALPGRRGGHPATSITCGGVTQGLYADGWHDDCQQDGLTIVTAVVDRDDRLC